MEWYREGRVPLHTLRADIDYGVATAFTTFGTCGVKVWVFKGEIMAHDPMAHDKRAEEAAPQRTAGARRAHRAEGRVRSHAVTQAHQVPQGLQGPHQRRRQGRVQPRFRLLRAEGDGAGPPDRAPDRGRPPRHHASHEACGRVWIRVFPDVPVSKKPAEVRMGSGKGAPEFWAARVKPGRILFELDGVTPLVAKEALALGAAKLPIKTRFVARVGAEG